MFKDTVVVALGTAASRVTGVLRIVLIGVILGQTALADAFDGANNSPNSIYELLVGGLLAASLVPLFTRFASEKDDEATSAVISVSIVLLIAITALAVVAAPLIFRLYSLRPSDLVDANEYRKAGTAMARIFLVQIFFYGLTAICTALLNARRRFAAAAWAPVVANVVTIAFLLLVPSTIDGTPQLRDILDNQRFFLYFTVASTAGIASMALTLIPALRRESIEFHFRFDLSHPAVRTMITMSMWTFGYVVTNQVALIVIKNLAEPGSGNQDAYAKAFVFFMLPHSLLTLSIATTFVPELVRRVVQKDNEGFQHWMTLGVRWTTLLTIPASLGLAILAHPFITTVLQYGNFSANAALHTSQALTGFAVGLTGFSLYLFTLRGFYAHNDTRTPFVVNVMQNTLNIALAFFLVDRHGVFGLGLAFGISYLVAAIVTVALLHHRYQAINWTEISGLFVPVILASGIMAIVLWQGHIRISPTNTISHIVEISLLTVVGIMTYAVILHIAGIRDLANMYRNFTQSRRKTSL